MILYLFAALCAYFVKGLCGFANTLVFSSILSFGVSNISISPVDLILGFPSNVILVWKNRKELNWKIWAPLAALVLLGSLPGIFLLKNVDARFVKIMFGIAVAGIAVEMLYREYRLPATRQNAAPSKASKLVLILVGLLSGVLCGLYGVGALLAAYMSRVSDSSRSFKANMCAVFITENVFRILLYNAAGILTLAVLRQALVLVPAMLAGLWLGAKSAGRLKESTVKKVVILFLLFSGISLVLTNLLIHG